MIGLIGVEVTKVRTARMWIGLLLGAVAIVTLGAVATLAVAGSAEGAEAGVRPVETLDDVRVFVATGSIAGVFALLLGATTMTTEHRHRTLSATFLATPTRWPVVLAKVVGSSIVGLAFGLIGAAIPLVAVAISFAIDGEVMPFGASVLLAFLGVGAGAAFSAAMGAAVGAALRNQLLAILAVLGWALVVEGVVGAIVPATVRWFPFSGLTGSLTQTGGDLFAPLTAGVLMIGYVGVAVAIGVAFTLRRDVE